MLVSQATMWDQMAAVLVFLPLRPSCHPSSGLGALPCQGVSNHPFLQHYLYCTFWRAPTQLPKVCFAHAPFTSHRQEWPTDLFPPRQPFISAQDICFPNPLAPSQFPKISTPFFFPLLESHFSSLLPPDCYCLPVLPKIKWKEENKIKTPHVTPDYSKRQKMSQRRIGFKSEYTMDKWMMYPRSRGWGGP